VVRSVVIEVVVELVGDVGELLEEVVGILFAAGPAGMSEEVLDLLVARVEELDEDEDAIAWEIGGVAELFYFTFRQGVVAALGVEGRDEGEED
jgi:hypothetical protein